MMNNIKEFDYTLVIGVDRKHLDQLRLVWPTWMRHKPEFAEKQVVIFYDHESGLTEENIRSVAKHRHLRVCQWPFPDVKYAGDETSKWYHPQRYKMLAGFVHVPALLVNTPYWLKLDTDVVATGQRDWIDLKWFKNNPAIVAHRWGFTKPANQMDLLDAWVEKNRKHIPLLSSEPPLELHPQPGSERVGHKRIISWCGFFSTIMTRLAASFASSTCGPFQLPVPSQDGYLWYVSERMRFDIQRTNMKELGWEWWSTDKNVRAAAQRALA